MLEEEEEEEDINKLMNKKHMISFTVFSQFMGKIASDVNVLSAMI